MSGMDGEIASWLRATITARLALARAATQASWEAEGDDPTDDEVWIDVDGEEWRMVICRGPQSHENMLHIAANDPRAVTARCEADLAILDVCERVVRDDGVRHAECGAVDFWSSAAVARITIRFLASGWRYADGYKPEWAPDA